MYNVAFSLRLNLLSFSARLLEQVRLSTAPR
jgi:hypothetical protein